MPWGAAEVGAVVTAVALLLGLDRWLDGYARLSGAAEDAIDFAILLAWLGATLGLVRLRRGRPADIGLRVARLRWYLLAPALCVATLFVEALTITIMTAAGFQFRGAVCDAVEPGVATTLLAAVQAVLLAPVTEEVVFRGFLYGWLRERVPWLISVAVTALLWAGLHLDAQTIVPLIGAGLVLGAVREWSGSLWPPLMIHVLLNGVAAAIALGNGCL